MGLSRGNVHAIAFRNHQDSPFFLHVLQNGLQRPRGTSAGDLLTWTINEGHIEAGSIVVRALAIVRIRIAPSQSALLFLRAG